MLPINYLRSKYEVLSSVFITEVNNNTITLYMSINETLTDPSVAEIEPGNFSRYGGKQRLDDANRRIDEGGSDKKEVPSSLSIPARVYWERRPVNGPNLTVAVSTSKNKCKIITYIEHLQLLLDTDYAVINGYKCKMVKNPAPYGLFGKQWISADFEEITGA